MDSGAASRWKGMAPALTGEQRAVLQLEKEWSGRYSTKAAAIRAAGFKPTHYYLVLRSLLEAPAAELEEPELIRRLRRLRDRRVRERGGRVDG
ncbi:DUF3263 domain-containing protein [Neoactinobaculum massilliense]|uniref:DUF3263 domain-containing protein n=1 Tax=Neoactinobaculum massilliense TaxID=2364794 RepID=UPI0013DDA6D3|nr:DUF3263 domain-containing protein [Neoactinobaculum massilliense]